MLLLTMLRIEKIALIAIILVCASIIMFAGSYIIAAIDVKKEMEKEKKRAQEDGNFIDELLNYQA